METGTIQKEHPPKNCYPHLSTSSAPTYQAIPTTALLAAVPASLINIAADNVFQPSWTADSKAPEESAERPSQNPEDAITYTLYVEAIKTSILQGKTSGKTPPAILYFLSTEK